MTLQGQQNENTSFSKLQRCYGIITNCYRVNRTKVIWCAGMMLLMFALSGSLFIYSYYSDIRADMLLSQHFQASITGEKDMKQNINSFRDIISQYPKSSAAALARFQIGNLYFQRRDIKNAMIIYRDFIDNSPSYSKDIRILAYNQIAAGYVIEKDYQKALHYIKKALGEDINLKFVVLENENMGRILESMNNPSKAVEFYQKILDKTNNPMLRIYIKRKLFDLKGHA